MSCKFSQLKPLIRAMECLNVNVPLHGETLFREVFLWNADSVIVMGTQQDDEALRVVGPDVDGRCFLRIPVTADTEFFTLDEVDEIIANERKES